MPADNVVQIIKNSGDSMYKYEYLDVLTRPVTAEITMAANAHWEKWDENVSKHIALRSR